MRFLRLLCIALMAMLITATFLACSKNKDSLPEQTTSKTPLPGSPAGDSSSYIIGLWSGEYFGQQKSMAVHFGFRIKDKGQLEVLDAGKTQIGSGSWTLNGNSFKALYTILTSRNIYSFGGELYSSTGKLNGTWGYGYSMVDGGIWSMEKIK